MGLSSNILWHQTNKDALKKILKQKCFRYSYSLECIESERFTLELAFPMLSLCDIPFADIGEYLTKYGGNSIGLSREWGINHRITPVIYCEPTSNLLNSINDFIINNANDNVFSFATKLLSHIKNHDGQLPKYNYRRYRFYDEREMRIIPTSIELERTGQKPILKKERYNDYKLDNNNSSLLPNELNIPFSYNDIRYFILKDDKSIAEIKDILSKEIDLRTTNISFFTTSQIKEDFIGENHNEVIDDEKNNLNNHKNNYIRIAKKADISDRSNKR